MWVLLNFLIDNWGQQILLDLRPPEQLRQMASLFSTIWGCLSHMRPHLMKQKKQTNIKYGQSVGPFRKEVLRYSNPSNLGKLLALRFLI